MKRSRVTTLAALASGTLLLTPAAEAKFDISLTVEPSRPIAGEPIRVTMRTGVVLPKKHGMRLNAVGPWREESGRASSTSGSSGSVRERSGQLSAFRTPGGGA